MKNKIIFIPGWMDTVENLVNWPGLDIWKKKIDINQKIEAEYVVGYSSGANWALVNWQKNKNTKLILVSPLVPKRKVRNWFFRWLKHEIFEGSKISAKRSKCFHHVIRGIVGLVKLMQVDPILIIDEIPKENIVIVKGKKDNNFFDAEAAEMIKEKRIRLIELEEVGHNWNKKIILEVQKIVEN
jgi:hypothetical protein